MVHSKTIDSHSSFLKFYDTGVTLHFWVLLKFLISPLVLNISLLRQSTLKINVAFWSCLLALGPSGRGGPGWVCRLQLHPWHRRPRSRNASTGQPLQQCTVALAATAGHRVARPVHAARCVRASHCMRQCVASIEFSDRYAATRLRGKSKKAGQMNARPG